MNYPHLGFTKTSTPQEYEVWRHLSPHNTLVVGYINRTKRKTWQIDIATRHYGQRITEIKYFEDAKQMARELLA